jgi:hypothetical protein
MMRYKNKVKNAYDSLAKKYFGERLRKGLSFLNIFTAYPDYK